jgi:hypothetical protein
VAWTQNSLPRARTDALLVEQVEAETVVYDLDSKDVHCLSPLAAAVFEYCDGRTALARIAELAQQRLGEQVTEDDVAAAAAQLDERSLLDTPPLILREGISRRELAKKSAKYGAAAASVPLIASIVAPAAMAQGSVIPAGCTGCGGPAANQQCAPEAGASQQSAGHCCQDVAGKACNRSCCVGENNSCQLREVAAVNVCSTTLTPEAECATLECPPGSTMCCCCNTPTPNCPPCSITPP